MRVEYIATNASVPNRPNPSIDQPCCMRTWKVAIPRRTTLQIPLMVTLIFRGKDRTFRSFTKKTPKIGTFGLRYIQELWQNHIGPQCSQLALIWASQLGHDRLRQVEVHYTCKYSVSSTALLPCQLPLGHHLWWPHPSRSVARHGAELAGPSGPRRSRRWA